MFFKEWVDKEPEFEKNNCKIVKLIEIPNSREEIYNQLVETVINSYSNHKRIKNYLQNEKYSKLENYINRRLPTSSDHMKGDFGEIFGTEHLKQVHDYVFPVTKLRYKFKYNRSLEGEDILGFFIEGDEITRICVGESKVRSSSDSSVWEDMFTQLKKSYDPHPVLLNFFSERVYEINEDLGDKIEDLMSPDVFHKVKKDNWIFYITGFRPRTFNVDNTSGELSNLVLVHIYFDDLEDFIINVFDDCRGYYNKK